MEYVLMTDEMLNEIKKRQVKEEKPEVKKGIRIKVRKFTQDGRKMFEILGVRVLPKDCLPKDYTEARDRAVICKGRFRESIWQLLPIGVANKCLLAVGTAYTQFEFQTAMQIIKEAGRHLEEVNKKLREEHRASGARAKMIRDLEEAKKRREKVEKTHEGETEYII